MGQWQIVAAHMAFVLDPKQAAMLSGEARSRARSYVYSHPAVSALPAPVTELVDVLAAIPGVVAVVLGGSHAVASNDAESDWDLGAYYRGAIDVTALAAFGDVHPRDRGDAS